MEIGIDSFAGLREGENDGSKAINELIERIQFADQSGLHVFGIGEHHRKEFLDSSPFNILSAAAGRLCIKPAQQAIFTTTPASAHLGCTALW